MGTRWARRSWFRFTASTCAPARTAGTSGRSAVASFAASPANGPVTFVSRRATRPQHGVPAGAVLHDAGRGTTRRGALVSRGAERRRAIVCPMRVDRLLPTSVARTGYRQPLMTAERRPLSRRPQSLLGLVVLVGLAGGATVLDRHLRRSVELTGATDPAGRPRLRHAPRPAAFV